MKLPDYKNIYAELPSIMIDGIMLMDMKGFILDCNDSLADLTQFTREELLSMNWKQFANPAHITHWRSIYYMEVTERGYSELGEIEIQRKDGKIIHVEVRVRLISADTPSTKFTFVVIRDISRRKKAEKELRKSKKLLQNVLDTIPGLVFWKDKSLRYLGGNKNFMKYAKVSSIEEVLGKTDYDFGWVDSSSEKFQSDDLDIMETGNSRINFDEKIQYSPTEYRWMRTSKIPLRDEHDEIYGILGTAHDITEEKKTNIRMRESEARLLSIFENSPISIWEQDYSEVRKYFLELKSKGVGNLQSYFMKFPDKWDKCLSLVKTLDINKNTILFHEWENKKKLLSFRNSPDFAKSLPKKYKFTYLDAVLTLFNGNNEIHTIWKVITHSGKEKWLLGYLTIVPGYEKTWGRVIRSDLDMTEQFKAERALLKKEKVLKNTIQELNQALDKIKTLNDLLPICANCKKIRDDQGYWKQVETYISDHTNTRFSHGICPDCAKKLYGDIL